MFPSSKLFAACPQRSMWMVLCARQKHLYPSLLNLFPAIKNNHSCFCFHVAKRGNFGAKVVWRIFGSKGVDIWGKILLLPFLELKGAFSFFQNCFSLGTKNMKCRLTEHLNSLITKLVSMSRFSCSEIHSSCLQLFFCCLTFVLQSTSWEDRKVLYK